MNALVPTLAGLALGLAAFGTSQEKPGLKRLAPGEQVPDFSLPALGGGQIESSTLAGKHYVLVFVAARQRSSQAAATGAFALCKEFEDRGMPLLLVTPDIPEAPYLERQRSAHYPGVPIGLDFERKLARSVGLDMLPTTMVVGSDGKLAHVLRYYSSEYEHQLRIRIQHALGLMDDDAFAQAQEVPNFRRDRPEDRIARHRAAAQQLREAGQLADAEGELRAALEIDAGHVSARLDLGALQLARGEPQPAEEMARAVLEDDPRNRRAALLLGVALFDAGDDAAAEQALREALEHQPDPSRVHYYLGQLCERRGDKDGALEHYKKALAGLIKPDSL